MAQRISTLVYPVSDLARATALYRRLLGVEPSMDTPYYVGFNVDGQEIGLDPNGHRNGLTGPVAYCQVDDIRTSLQALLDAGAQPHQEVKDVGGGKLVASVSDADGNLLGLIQPAG